jgi:AcrR family transcriptional regulator
MSEKTNPSYLDKGRVDQKLRTRQRVLEAAARMIAQGQSPTVTEAADHAEVSRRTAYRYFRTQQHMLAEAALTLARAEIADMELPPEIDRRVDKTVRAVQSFVYQNEAALRLLVQMNIRQPLAGKSSGRKGAVGPRVNRVRFIENALSGVRGRMKEDEYERLVSALVLCMGIESAMALSYIRKLSPAHATDVCAWAAQQILRGALKSQPVRLDQASSAC